MWKVLHSRWTVVLQVGVCYIEHYVEGTAQLVDSGIAGWMECVTVNIMWKVLHRRWIVVLQVEWSVLQWTLCGRYCTAGGQWNCRLNGVCYSEHYVEGTAQQVDSGIAGWMVCVTVNIMWKVLHSRWTVVLQVEWSVLQWTLCGKYCTDGGQWYCGLNGVCYSEHYVEGSAQQVDSVTAGWMECVTVNMMWKVLHSRWTVLLQFDWSVLQWTLCGRYFIRNGNSYCSLNELHYIYHEVKLRNTKIGKYDKWPFCKVSIQRCCVA